MPFAGWIKRQKDKLKRASSAQNQGPVSPPNPIINTLPEPSYSQTPQVATTPESQELAGVSEPVSSDKTSYYKLVPSFAGSRPVETGRVATSAVSLNRLHTDPFPSEADAVPVISLGLPPGVTLKPERRAKKIKWSGLNTLSGILKLGAETFSPLESAIGGLERCIGIFERASKARGEYQELGEKLDQLLGDLAQFRNGWMGKGMTTSVKSLCSGIEAELKVVEEKQRRNSSGQYFEATEDLDAILECYRRIHGHVERLILNANLNMWKVLDEEMTVGTHLDTIYQHSFQFRIQDRRLLRLSPTMSGNYNSWVSDRTKRCQCTEGTRVPELHRLKEWVRNPSTASPIYWINGMAGTGKTTIAYTLCDELHTTGELAASFFCTRLIPECRDIQLIIPAISYQLAQFSLPFRHALSKVLESDMMAHTRELKLQFRTLITDPLETVRHTLPSGIVVVIDALDECEDRDSIGKILDLLVGCTCALPVRFLVSSRPEPEIYHRMMKQVGSNPEAKLVLHELDSLDVQRDIGAYVRQELQDVPLTTKQWNGLLERCGVLFIYASTACRYIKYGDEMMSREEAISTVLGLSFEGGDMEKELDKLYTTILEAAFNRPQINEANRKRMKAILDAIICAQAPMTNEALAGLLGLKSGKHAITLLRPLFSVVNVTEDRGIATTLHASFPDFMLSPGRSGTFHCAATEQHIMLTQACLRQIRLNPVQFNICGIESSYLLDEEIADLPARIKGAISPALFYACFHWAAHLELVGPSIDLQEPVFDFLTARLLLWMEVMSLKKSLTIGVSIMEQIKKWCRVAHVPKETIELVYDAFNFVSFYEYHLVSFSTAHIYVSMLPFWPSTSPIAQHYMPRTSRLLRPQGTAISRRSLPCLATRYMGEPMGAVSYTPDGTQIVAAVGGSIYKFDGWTGQIVLGPLEGHNDLVASIAISHSGSLIASGSYDATIRVWDAKSGELVTGPFKAHRERVTSIAFSPDGVYMVSTGVFEAPCVWSVRNGQRLVITSPFSECSDGARTAVFTTDGLSIITCDDNNTICYWDAHTGSLISKQPSKHSGCAGATTISNDGLRFISTSEDGDICVSGAEHRQTALGPLKLSANADKIHQTVLSPNNLYIATCTKNGTTDLWEAGSGEFVTSFFGRNAYLLTSAAFSPDSSRLVSCSGDGILCIWNVQSTGKGSSVLGGSDSGIHAACLSADGLRIVTGGMDGSIWLWDTRSGELVVGPLTGHKEYICSVAISSDGAYIASASRDKTIRLWDTKGDKSSYMILEHHTKQADSLRFSPDNSRLFYGSLVYSIGHSSFTSEIISGLVNDARDEWAGEVRSNDLLCITSSPDGLFVASSSADGIVQIWDAQTGQLIMGPFEGHTLPISRILFSLDGKRMVSCSLDGTMRFWPISGKSNHSKTADTCPAGESRLSQA
ncbi:vegetative incompatibility protein HET-E-1, putative [Rhizoctonia solani AG-3 Rhs1AP]|uniref:Vegetative incompatibility protein HET-E-1, putative n=1 Tax=Rhizoctonia solani AG-3 Rhs1AP TaxID=1086054 RepID=X8J1G8_9AGAM|nr:vegetative incompatibility protein HET-E-1, putative [Rhizoctonia solani AG-3 Rhs1AP]